MEKDGIMKYLQHTSLLIFVVKVAIFIIIWFLLLLCTSQRDLIFYSDRIINLHKTRQNVARFMDSPLLVILTAFQNMKSQLLKTFVYTHI